jgi:hypothetical protein
MNDYGWLIVLYADDYRSKRVLPPGTTHVEATRVAREALRADRRLYKAWIIKKTVRNQER